MTVAKRKYEKPTLKKSTSLLQSVVAQFPSVTTTPEGDDEEEIEVPNPALE